MLARFRMNVEECLTEYRNLGESVFGHPRPLAFGAMLMHKYSSKNLEAVIQDVTRRRSEPCEFETDNAMDEHLRSWYVDSGP